LFFVFGSVIVVVRTLMTDKLSLQHPLYGIVRAPSTPILVGGEKLVSRLHPALEAYVTSRSLGKVWRHVEVVLEQREGIVLQPDLTFIVDGRESIVTDRVWGPPDMVLDVTSPHTRSRSLDERIAWYSLYGVREYWLVQPQQASVTILELAHGGVRRRTVFDDDTPLQSPLLPDFDRCLGDFLI
jgi:Uma2 family endonuclease